VNPVVLCCTALGQALATESLYDASHPMRTQARARVLGALHDVLAARGPLTLSFLDGDVVVGSRVLPELRGWDWGTRFSRAGVQRLEFTTDPRLEDEGLAHLLSALHTAVTATAGTPFTPVITPGVRAGPLTVDGAGGDAGPGAETVTNLLDALAQIPVDEEAAAVRYIHDEVARGHAVPLAEVELVIRSLAAAMHRDQHIILPLLDLKTVDQYTTTHSCNVAMLAMGLAEQLGIESAMVRDIGTAALLHDIGKVLTPPDILVKPGRLTEAELAQMRLHPVHGARILSERGRGHVLAAIVAYEHHVWEDGAGGYPGFTFARRCHPASRLVHVCDLYDALSTKRPYREAWSRDRALGFLRERAGIEIDPEMVAAFERMATQVVEQRQPLRDTPQDDWTASVTRATEAHAAPGTRTVPVPEASPSPTPRETASTA
jgi:putative nucleotidyltransferase with HDIG domain